MNNYVKLKPLPKHKKSESQRYSIMLVPSHGGEIKQISLSLITFRTYCFMVVLFFCLLISAAVHYQYTISEATHVIIEKNHLKAENEDLNKKIISLTEQTKKMNIEIEKMKKLSK